MCFGGLRLSDPTNKSINAPLLEADIAPEIDGWKRIVSFWDLPFIQILHPGQFTWIPKMEVRKIVFLFNGVISRFHVEHFQMGYMLVSGRVNTTFEFTIPFKHPQCFLALVSRSYVASMSLNWQYIPLDYIRYRYIIYIYIPEYPCMVYLPTNSP